MITTFKYFESFDSDEPKFNVGDFVYCINNNNLGMESDNLKYDTKYEIIESVKGHNNFLYKLKGLQLFLKENRFISEAEYDAKKYNL